MRIEYLKIKHFKFIKELEIDNIENALILVGQNNIGKSTILDALRAVSLDYIIKPQDFTEEGANIEIDILLRIFEEDFGRLQKQGLISKFRKQSVWKKEFLAKFPSFKQDLGADADGGILSFKFIANKNGKFRWEDTGNKNNQWIPQILPKIYYIDAERNLTVFEQDMLFLQENNEIKNMRGNCCLFNTAKTCNHCFSCIGLINKKNAAELTALETAKLLEYKIYQMNLDGFEEKVNRIYRNNGGQDRIRYSMNNDMEHMLSVRTEICMESDNVIRPIERMGRGMRSIYMMSLLEANINDPNARPCIIMVEEPEIFLHPTLQKKSGDILYRLSKKHQVIFSTHSPNLLPNFNSRQIKQMVSDESGNVIVRKNTDISAILSDLGYTANDLMNVNFVFIVEGKQDKSRLPMLLRKYYSEMYDENGKLSRIAIITTNSCTNIRTYANLKYMNQVYIRDQFLMIRDGDGKNAEKLKRQLCNYYEEQNRTDVDHLPRVTPKNVLVLKYYSFENYFLNPEIMAKVGVIKKNEDFYRIFLTKWKEYLYKLKSGRRLTEVMGKDFETIEDVRDNMENIKRYLRGHNIFDIFYGRFRNRENEILGKYIDIAPKEEFEDILSSINRFIFFDSKKL